jgi:low affinity Fe/Cu permease
MFVGIEHLTEEEIEELRDKCEARAKRGRATVHRVSAQVQRAADAAG